MVLSAADRQKRLRQKRRLAEMVTVRLEMPGRLRGRLKRAAATNEMGFHEYLLKKLAEPEK